MEESPLIVSQKIESSLGNTVEHIRLTDMFSTDLHSSYEEYIYFHEAH